MVRRLESGCWLRAPSSFTSEELPDRDAVRARFGGGSYEVIGRDAQRIAARTRFVLDGPALPLGHLEQKSSRGGGGRAGLHRFATEAGEREALCFRLFREGHSVQNITEMTGIESRIVRSIYVAWLTPSTGEVPTTPEQLSALEEAARRRAYEGELAAWGKAQT